jgi:LmbE family N-acetylglucosaminyl deacetylase
MLVIAPHPDDEILGVGGTMARCAKAGGEVTVLTVAAHMPPLYTTEAHQRTITEARKAHALIGVKESVFLNYPAVLLEDVPTHEFNKQIDDAVKRLEPEIVLIPFYDRHIDHRRIFDACMVATRPVGVGQKIKIVAAYETISETHWNAPYVEPMFMPNWCVDTTEFIDLKIAAMQCYESQLHAFPFPRSVEALRALALFRGSQAGMGYAEAFCLIRMTASPEEFYR